MNIVTYACFAYGMAAVISYLLIGVIVGIDSLMSRKLEKDRKKGEKR